MEHSDFGAYRDAVVAEETEQRGPGHPWPAERTERPHSNQTGSLGFELEELVEEEGGTGARSPWGGLNRPSPWRPRTGITRIVS
jgi:hypothetical protein